MIVMTAAAEVGTEPPGALDGIVVADFSRVLAGPYCTMLLGDLGATVLKIESPTGDETRNWTPPRRDGNSTYFMSINRNKRSIALDLGDPDDQRIARAIVDRSDIVVENLLPGRMAGFGLDWETVSAQHPQLVYASISGFGEHAGAALPGYDLLVQAMSGFMSLTGEPEHSGYRAGFALFDVLAGLHTGMAVLAALRHAERTGLGQWVRTDLVSVALSSMVNQTGAAVLAGVTPQRMGNAHPSIYPYEPFPTADGDLVLAVGNDRQFARLCAVLGVPQLSADPEFARASARSEHRARLKPLLVQALGVRNAVDWMAALQPAGVPCAVVQDLAGGIRSATDLGLDPVATVEGEPTVRNPVRFSRTTPTYRRKPPPLDAQRAEILEWLAR